MTPGEKEMAQSIYGNSIDYSKVDIKGGGIFTIGGYARVIGNTIYFPSENYQEDFSKASLGLRAFSIHEIMHIYQHQKDPTYKLLAVLLEHLLNKDPYLYVLDENKKLSDYKFEQQAKIVQDYYTIKEQYGKNPTKEQQEELNKYRKIIESSFEGLTPDPNLYNTNFSPGTDRFAGTNNDGPTPSVGVSDKDTSTK